MAAALNDPRRLIVELLARTGMHASEVCDLAAERGRAHLTDTGYASRSANSATTATSPCTPPDRVAHPMDRRQPDHIRANKRLVADHRGSLDRHGARPIVRRVGRRVGVTVHPHQLRHTLATQAINRGMRLEAIAALLGHRTMHMTLTYAESPTESSLTNTTINTSYTPMRANCRPTTTPGWPNSTRSTRPNARDVHPPVELDCRLEISLRNLQLLRQSRRFSFPSCSANQTTPATTSPNEPTSSTTSSTEPKHALDNDHPYNGRSGRTTFPCAGRRHRRENVSHLTIRSTAR